MPNLGTSTARVQIEALDAHDTVLATAASAAAIVMMKMANTCPWSIVWGRYRANAMKLRLTAFSISSMDIRMAMAFRRVSAPNTPRLKRIAPRIR